MNDDREKHKIELKAAKLAYKESVLRGETWADLVKNDEKKSSQNIKVTKHTLTVQQTKKKNGPEKLVHTHDDRAKKQSHRYIDPEIRDDRRNAVNRKSLNKTNKKKHAKQPKDKTRKRSSNNEANLSLQARRQLWIERLHESMSNGYHSVTSAGQKVVSSYTAVVSDDFYLPWDKVTFANGQIIINPFEVKVRNFKPFHQVVIERREARKSFNYLRTYFNEKLPKIKCYISSTHGLVIIDTIKLDAALITLRKLEQKDDYIEYEETSNGGSTRFEISCSRGKRMSDDEFRKFKSGFIDHLLSVRNKAYCVIPCQECIRYEMSKETYDMEDAFMFILSNRDGSATIVYENLKVDRSTLLFQTERGKEMSGARQVFSFMSSMDINKRSSLRNKWIKMKGHGVIRYKSLNHTELWDWKSNLTVFRNGLYY